MFQAKCVLITWTFMALYLFIKWLFGFSIIAITALSVMMSVDFMVPDSHTLLAAVW
jgi:hypothetical protein